MEKEKLINLLISEDIEIKKLGIKILESEYIIPRQMYMCSNKSGTIFKLFSSEYENSLEISDKTIRFFILFDNLSDNEIRNYLDFIAEFTEAHSYARN